MNLKLWYIAQQGSGDHEFLFHLLKQRPNYANISHTKLPDFEQHCSFVDSLANHFYNFWYIVKDDELNRIGTIYITINNEIGLFIEKTYQKQGLGTQILQLFLQEYKSRPVFANISIKNDISKKFFSKNGFKLTSETYKL